MKNNIDITKEPKGVGFAGFLTWFIPTLLFAGFIIFSKVTNPCYVEGMEDHSGWTSCNNIEGDSTMFLIGLMTIGYTFFLLPTAFIVGVIAVAQKTDVKWGWIAMAPAMLALFSGGLFPFGLMSLLDNF